MIYIILLDDSKLKLWFLLSYTRDILGFYLYDSIFNMSSNAEQKESGLEDRQKGIFAININEWTC